MNKPTIRARIANAYLNLLVFGFLAVAVVGCVAALIQAFGIGKGLGILVTVLAFVGSMWWASVYSMETRD